MNPGVCILILIMLVGGIPLACGQDAGRILKISPEQFDFGTVDEGIAATVNTVVHNTGSTKMEITNVRTN
jgi:hypothetical protein